MRHFSRQRGFTLVELLIVIVVIAILAAITIVAYNGVQQRARTSVLQADLEQASKQVASFQAVNGIYPTSVTDCPTPGTTTICLKLASGETIANYGSSAAISSYCIELTSDAGTLGLTNGGSMVANGCSRQSCYAIQQAGQAHGDGIYWVKPSGATAPIPAYCDMTIAGGGWTLLVTNPTYGIWNGTNVLAMNTDTPSISAPYSILGRADNIKSNIGGNLQYMLDAGTRGNWGGVWSAPFSNTLEGSTIQNTATMTQKLGTWTQDSDLTTGTDTPTNIVPYMTGDSKGLVTWGGTGNWYGTIVEWQQSFSPAPWMTPTNQNPGIIWYWVR